MDLREFDLSRPQAGNIAYLRVQRVYQVSVPNRAAGVGAKRNDECCLNPRQRAVVCADKSYRFSGRRKYWPRAGPMILPA